MYSKPLNIEETDATLMKVQADGIKIKRKIMKKPKGPKTNIQNTMPIIKDHERYEEIRKVGEFDFQNSLNILEVTEEKYLAELKSNLLKCMEKQKRKSKKKNEVGGWCCKICVKISPSKTHMMEHIQAFHMRGIEIPCEFCDKTFTQTVNLRKHKLYEHLRK